jgi:anti-sigma B factor antagonist
MSKQRDEAAGEQLAGADFEVQDSVSGGRHTLILRGELDLQPAMQLEQMLKHICVEGTTGIVIDLSKLTFMGSTGLRAILLARDLCEQHGYEFFIVPGPRNVQRLFELTGLDELLPLADEGDAQSS